MLRTFRLTRKTERIYTRDVVISPETAISLDFCEIIPVIVLTVNQGSGEKVRESKEFALCVVGPGSISGTTFGSPALPGVTPEYRIRICTEHQWVLGQNPLLHPIKKQAG